MRWRGRLGDVRVGRCEKRKAAVMYGKEMPGFNNDTIPGAVDDQDDKHRTRRRWEKNMEKGQESDTRIERATSMRRESMGCRMVLFAEGAVKREGGEDEVKGSRC